MNAYDFGDFFEIRSIYPVVTHHGVGIRTEV